MRGVSIYYIYIYISYIHIYIYDFSTHVCSTYPYYMNMFEGFLLSCKPQASVFAEDTWPVAGSSHAADGSLQAK